MASRWKPSTRSWGEKAYDEVMAKYPDIRTGSVALCVWAYARNRDTTIEELREIAKTDKDIGAIVGRAQGSARQILSQGPTKKKGAKRKAKRGPRRPKKQAPAAGLAGFLESIKATEKERDQLRRALEKIKATLESVL